MRDYTPEEKELIINTPITKECFDLSKTHNIKCYGVYIWTGLFLYWKCIDCFAKVW